MQMDAGLDTGAMLRVEHTPIAPDDSTASLHDRLAEMGARLLLLTLADLAHGRLRPQAQPAEGVSYAHKIAKTEAVLDWQQPAAVLERRLRAFDPFPGGAAEIDGQALKVWRASVVPGSGKPGQRLAAGDDRLVVACGDGSLELLEVQVPGGRRITAAEFLQRQGAAAG